MKYNTVYKFIFVPALLLSLQSCFVAKKYERPEELPVNEALFRTDKVITDTISMANVPWQEVFADSLLQAHIQTTLENNLDIRIAAQNILAAQAYLKQGKAGYLPTLGVSGSYAFADPSDYSSAGAAVEGTVQQQTLTANLSWELDVWGKIRSQKRAFGASYLQTLAAHKAVKTELISSVASLYYQLLALDKKMNITRTSIEARKNALEATKALKEAGQVSAVAVKQTVAQLYTSQIILINLENQEELLENTMSVLMGQTPHAISRTTLDKQSISTPLKLGVPSLLLENRPDVLAAEYGLRNAFELSNVARANFYPSLSISAAGGFQSLELENWFSSSAIFGNIAANLFQPLLNGRKIRTAYEVSLTRQEQALLNYKKVLLTAGKEVSNALVNYQTATEVMTIQEKQTAALKDATTYSQKLLNNGLANYLEVLRARQSALNAELNLVDSHYQQLNSMVTLYQALGGGWK